MINNFSSNSSTIIILSVMFSCGAFSGVDERNDEGKRRPYQIETPFILWRLQVPSKGAIEVP
jgi:hypothetical protein